MTEYKRVVVNAGYIARERLSDAFMSPDEGSLMRTETDEITLVADPTKLDEFIATTGKTEGWRKYVDDIKINSIEDVSELPEDIRNVVEDVTPRVWELARQHLPDGADLDEYIFSGRIGFTCMESSIKKKNASPVDIETVQTWIDDNEFGFNREDANPTQNSDFEGSILDWAAELEDDHPEAEMHVTGSLKSPKRWEPHGSAYINGITVSMKDGSPISNDLLSWTQERFHARYDEHADGYIPYDEDRLIVRAYEFEVVERYGQEWLRMWWD